MKYGNLLENCTLCTRNCGVNRLEGKLGICMASIGVTNGFVQEEGTNINSYVPSFNNEGV